MGDFLKLKSHTFEITLKSLFQALKAAQQYSEINEEIYTDSGIALPIFFNTLALEKANIFPNDEVYKFIFFAQKGLSFDSYSCCAQIISQGGLFVGEIEKTLNSSNRTLDWVQDQIDQGHFIPVVSGVKALSAALQKASGMKPEDFVSFATTGTNGKTSITQILGDLSFALSKNNAVKIGTCEVGKNQHSFF
jgi:UDP-N-acetylmuramoyl-L-alanyl-D-glutamate--2,6-diaminopimelate ligase